MGFSSTKETPGWSFQSAALLLDASLSTCIGLFLYFAPHVVADFAFQRETDGVHWHLIRCVGGQILSTAWVNFQLRNSAPLARTVCFLLRILSSLLILMLTFHCRSQTPDLVNPQVIEWTTRAGFAILVFYILNLLYIGWPVGSSLYFEYKVGNFLYQLDGLASIAIGAAWLTFPAWLLHRQVLVTLDPSHELCGRVMGAMFVASFCISQHALHWASFMDRMVVVNSRAVCCIGILGAQIWSQAAYENDWTSNHWVGITLFSIWTTLAILYCAYLRIWASPPKDKEI